MNPESRGSGFDARVALERRCDKTWMAGTCPGHDGGEASSQTDSRNQGSFPRVQGATKPPSGSKNHQRAKPKFASRLNTLPIDSSVNPSCKKIYFSFSEICGWFVSSRLDERGTFWPVVTGHEAWLRWTQGDARVFFAGRTAPLRTAKSCGPDTPTLASSRREMISPMTGARKPGPRGARRTPLKPLCREGRMIRLNLL
jgi:hypothetical protein